MKTLQKMIYVVTVLVTAIINAQTETENYIKTTVYQTEVQDGQQSEVLESDKIVSVNYYDGLGRPKQTIAVRAGGQQQNTNIFDWTDDWKVGTGSTGLFNMTGRAVDNKREFGTNPFGEESLLWRCGNNNNIQTNAGWNSDHFDVDKNVGYMYTVWMKRTGVGSALTYHGIWNVDFAWGGSAGNPYFLDKKLPSANTWYLVVGMIHPYTYTGGSSTISGIYDINGNKVVSGTDFKWRSNTTSTRLRDFYYDAGATNSYAYYWNPRMVIVDNNSQPISQIIEASKPKDIITHYEYDNYGRQSKEYLPYASEETQNGNIYTNPLTELNAFYDTPKYQNTPNPYSETIFEASPLNRSVKQAAPGTDWQAIEDQEDHTIKYDRRPNNSEDNVVYFKVDFTNDNTEAPELVKVKEYEDEELFVNILKDENWVSSDNKNRTTEEYTDKLGRVILKRMFDKNIPHDTYYVYDDFGNLTYVLPPKVDVADGISDTELKELCYQYEYDRRNRLIGKKIPGKGWEYIVYNKLDQPVMTQDANQREKSPKEWLFTKYDAFGRVAYTGSLKNNETRASLQTSADNPVYTQFEIKQTSSDSLAGTTIYYSNNAIPRFFDIILTINYYDDYTFDRDGLNKPSSVFGVTTNNTPKALSTGSKVRVLGTDSWITTVIAYDSKGRVIWTGKRNDYLGTTDITELLLDFNGRVVKNKSTHTKSGTTITTVDTFSYDHMGRILTHKQKINNQSEELISKNYYDDLGQLESKKVGNAEQAPLQVIDYKYNVRGWLTDINNINDLGTDLFTFKINYNDPQISGSSALYNGNISETRWKTANDNTLRNYYYTYDDLNRITSGYFGANSKFNLNSVSYDKNGNIKKLQRGLIKSPGGPFGATTTYLDNLTYIYDSGNKLLKVNEGLFGLRNEGFIDGSNANDDYGYDANGNLTIDPNKKINEIRYNHLNLPTRIMVNYSNFINYIYDATGAKQEKKLTNKVTHYADNFIYETIGGAGTFLQFMSHSEGYAEPKNQNDLSKGFNYIYQYLDHLGNIRLSYSDKDNDGKIDVLRNNTDIDGDNDYAHEIKEVKDYYPFGMTLNYGADHPNSTVTGREHQYDFLGQESQKELGLNWIDLTVRNYDPSIARFLTVDPVAGVTESLSVYHYAYNNPLYFLDPTGLTGETFATVYKDEDGNVLLDTNDGSDDIITVPNEEKDDFLELISYTSDDMLNSKVWNDHFKSEFLGISLEELNALDGFSTQWARQNAIDYLENPTLENALALSYSEALSQWTNPQNLLAAASIFAIRPRGNGIVYKRTDVTGNLKPYIGQAKDEARYIARQKEHARAHPNSFFEFEKIGNGSAKGKFPTSLDRAEQRALDKLGGPTNKSNPNGGTSNKKNVIKQKKK